MIPSPGLLTALKRSRLVARRAHPTIGVGERRSRGKGSGMEFMDYRQYEPGDDVRHLDPHLYLRTGSYFVRQHAVYRQLPVAIIVDGTASMAFGTPTKFDFARALASALAFVGLAGGDVVEVGVYAGSRLAWSPRVRGMRRAPVIFDWLAGQRSAGAGFGGALGAALPRLAQRGLVIVLSDWWIDDSETDLKVLGWLHQEIVAVHIAAPQELDPVQLGTGEVRLIDSESGHEIELLIDANVLDGYRTAYAARQERLRQQITNQLGRYLPVRSDMGLDRLLLHDWRRLGLIN
ncbi:MAG TPA: DUF58 domain-containing protein [Xanthobacteraceae bacterium]|nr:DUF58 domain-containing protein [Xanthobacteraceae bacterium]